MGEKVIDNKLPIANKKLGQHYLVDKNIINCISNDFANVADAILEVGPGPGILTQKLAQRNLPYHVIEMDQRFLPHLKELLTDRQITMADALQTDFSALIEKLGWQEKKHILLISNLPYNISVPLTLKFVQTPAIQMMTLMYQKEVAERIYSDRKKNSMGSLMALTQTYFSVSPLCQVSPACFLPSPKVDSTVLSFQRRPSPELSLAEFKNYERFLRLLFSMKRKQVGTILKSQFPAEKLVVAFSQCEISRTFRAETFNLEQVHILYRSLINTHNQ